MKSNDKGITLISLMVIVIVLLIIASISLSMGINDQEKTTTSVVKSELLMVQNAILQRKIRNDSTKTDYEELPGEKISKEEVQELLKKKDDSLVLKGKDDEYKQLDSQSLKQLGITNDVDTYIVNYNTGEVINKTQFENFEEILYVYSVE